MDTETKGNVCTMCGHEHKADGMCDCGCGMKKDMKEGAKVCTMCGHEHKKAGGSCDCGCGKM